MSIMQAQALASIEFWIMVVFDESQRLYIVFKVVEFEELHKQSMSKI